MLAFEDMQWADASLLDFVEYLLEWSRNHPLFVITLARPELAERRPTWGAGHRNFASLYLEPLSEKAMQELLQGLVPGLPPSLRSQILSRAEGVPLYAVETVRMLLDRGLIVEDASAYRVVGEVESLEVPETLHALVAARLDGLSPGERRLLQDAAVLGKTFAPAALVALSGLGEAELQTLLTGLVRKELLGLQSDPRSPEHGQYGFLQDIVRHVAYETISRRERRAKHLAAAEHLAAALVEEEVAEVFASHLLDAYQLDPKAPDAEALRPRAHGALLRAGERAASLGASAEAQRYFEQAGELAAEPTAQAAALTRAGEMASRATDVKAASLFERALALYEAAGDAHAAARVSASLAYVEQASGRLDEAIGRVERAYAEVGDDEPDAVLAFLLVRLGRAHWFAGDLDKAIERTERGLDIAEALQLTEALCEGWNNKAIIVEPRRPEEARGLFQLSLETALAHELYERASVTCGNLSDLGFQRDRYAGSVAYLEQALELARRIGDRGREWYALSELSYALTMLGRWEEALARLAEIPEEQLGSNTLLGGALLGGLELRLQRGQLDAARELLARFDELAGSGDVQLYGCYEAARAGVGVAERDFRRALTAAEHALGGQDTLGIGSQDIKHGFLHGLEAALALGDREKVEELLTAIERLPVGLRPPFLTAVAHRFRARLAGDDAAAARAFAAAAAGMRELELPFYLAVVQLEHGEWLASSGRNEDAEPLLADAREMFERLEALPWLERLDALHGKTRTEIPA